MGNTILIAEDDKLALKMLARYFSAFGFTVYPAATCAEAVKLADQYKPDCFLLDYHLGGETAADICRFVRGNEYLKKPDNHTERRHQPDHQQLRDLPGRRLCRKRRGLFRIAGRGQKTTKARRL